MARERLRAVPEARSSSTSVPVGSCPHGNLNGIRTVGTNPGVSGFPYACLRDTPLNPLTWGSGACPLVNYPGAISTQGDLPLRSSNGPALLQFNQFQDFPQAYRDEDHLGMEVHGVDQTSQSIGVPSSNISFGCLGMTIPEEIRYPCDLSDTFPHAELDPGTSSGNKPTFRKIPAAAAGKRYRCECMHSVTLIRMPCNCRNRDESLEKTTRNAVNAKQEATTEEKNYRWRIRTVLKSPESQPRTVDPELSDSRLSERQATEGQEEWPVMALPSSTQYGQTKTFHDHYRDAAATYFRKTGLRSEDILAVIDKSFSKLVLTT
ncbi:hypothetical protein JOM56_003107 [Amanita muscaria]